MVRRCYNWFVTVTISARWHVVVGHMSQDVARYVSMCQDLVGGRPEQWEVVWGGKKEEITLW